MTVAILADELIKQELLAKKLPDDVTVIWADSVQSLIIIEADVYMDLLFEMNTERTQQIKKLLPNPVFINAVPYTTKSIGVDFIRINAWPGLLQRSITEIALPAAVAESTVKEIFDRLQWKYIVTPDITGMITARVLAAIINEAYYTLGDKVSTREEIDIAMKLGTGYPYGPFEWSAKIGLTRIYELLQELTRTDKRYEPAPLLKEEATKQQGIRA